MPYHEMDEAEWRAFLLDPVRPAVLATTRKDGRPHAAPIWYDVDDDGSIVFTTGATTVKGYAIRRHGQVALVVQDDQPPFSFVIIDGEATWSEDLDELLAWATRLGGRYMGVDRADAFGARNAVPGELLIRVRPTRVRAEADIAD
jgi:PPOX class probable F420-dependent enzyme